MSAINHLFILNPRAFWTRRRMYSVLSGIHSYFRTSGPDEFYAIHISRFPREASGYIRSYAESLPAGTALRVYAVGGDGILFDCLNGIIHVSNAELGAIPYGNSNNFIFGFGKQSKALFRNIALQCTSSSIPVDVIQAGSNHALGYATVGMESRALFFLRQMLQGVEGTPLLRWLKRRFYNRHYYITRLIPGFNHQADSQYYKVDVDGEDMSGNYRTIHISNSAFFAGNWAPVHTSKPDDGLMDIIFGIPKGKLVFLYALSKYLRGQYRQLPNDFIVKQARKISISSDEPLYIGLDDETFFEFNLSLELMPGAVRFIDVTGKGFPG
jgi:diacylglycerol kinase family enzyme